MQNHQAIKDFADHWRKSPGFDIAPTGNCTFEANVVYSFNGKEVEEATFVTIIRNGFEDGKVSIREAGALIAELFHLDFSPDFQEFRYRDRDGSFIVTGDSQKMRGPYEVTISPI